MGRSLKKEYLEALSSQKYVFRSGSRFAGFVNFDEVSKCSFFPSLQVEFEGVASFHFDRNHADI